jgi:hypothetical protein
VFAWRKHLAAFPADALKVEKVPEEYGLSFQHVETDAAKPATLG